MKTSYINNRRYLGNKYKLLPFIQKVVDENCKDIKIVADLFAGTGAVSSVFIDKILITNDLLYSNYIANLAWFGSEIYDEKKIIEFINLYNNLSNLKENYMSENFADTYFSRENCMKIGFIRDDIELNFKNKKINERERAILITSLLYAMDKIASTCGHYDAYRKNGNLNQILELAFLKANLKNNPKNQIYNTDINVIAKDIKADLIYLDPPYNSRQYCDAYHLLENVAKWEKPKVFGTAKKMNRDDIKSDYCTVKAEIAFADLIANLNSKYILLSYNNTAKKANERSNAKISDEVILNLLKSRGKVEIFETDYKAFTTGKSKNLENKERLFLCKIS